MRVRVRVQVQVRVHGTVFGDFGSLWAAFGPHGPLWVVAAWGDFEPQNGH